MKLSDRTAFYPVIALGCCLAFFAALSPAAYSQCFDDPTDASFTRLSSTTLGTAADSSAVGVEVVGQCAYVSLKTDGKQVVVNVQNPYAPLVLPTINPLYSDQWNDPFYFNGFVFSAHRWGGLNMMDGINPSAGLLVVSSQSTNYHFKGLAGLNENGKAYLFYSEALTSGADGGLRIYEIDSGALVPTGSYISPDTTGGALAVTSDGMWAYQSDNGDRQGVFQAMSLNYYDVSDKNNVVFGGNLLLPTLEANRSQSADMVMSPEEDYLFMATSEDGLQVIDILDKANPLHIKTYTQNGFRIDGLVMTDPDTLIVTAYVKGSSSYILAELNVSLPGINAPILGVTNMPMAVVTDVFAANGLLYVTGRNGADEPVLEIWQ